MTRVLTYDKQVQVPTAVVERPALGILLGALLGVVIWGLLFVGGFGVLALCWRLLKR